MRHWIIGSIQGSGPFPEKNTVVFYRYVCEHMWGPPKPGMTQRTQWQSCQMPQRISASEIPNLCSSHARILRNCLINLSSVGLKSWPFLFHGNWMCEISGKLELFIHLTWCFSDSDPYLLFICWADPWLDTGHDFPTQTLDPRSSNLQWIRTGWL